MPDYGFIGATETTGSDVIGTDAGEISGIGKLGVVVAEDINTAANDSDVIIDFTNPESTLKSAEYCSENNKSMVIGTTGFSDQQLDELKEKLKNVPTVFSPNMSIGVNITFEIARKLAKYLGGDYDVEIVESHHRNKTDSPSGTAIKLGQEIAKGMAVDYNKVVKYGRHGNLGKRKDNEIGIQSLRGGDVVGEHTVNFYGKGERIVLSHVANSRENFSKGVAKAVKWIYKKEPGFYSMKDVLGLD